MPWAKGMQDNFAQPSLHSLCSCGDHSDEACLEHFHSLELIHLFLHLTAAIPPNIKLVQ